MLINYCKKNDGLKCLSGLARSPFVLIEHISSKIYIYVAVRQVICSCSVVRNVGGVKCELLSKA